MPKPEKIIGKLSNTSINSAMSKYGFISNWDSFMLKLNNNATYNRNDDKSIKYYISILDWYMNSLGCRTEVISYLFYVLTVQVWLIKKYSNLDELISCRELRIFDSELDEDKVHENDLKVLKQIEDINNEIALFNEYYRVYEEAFKCIENKDKSNELLDKIDNMQEQLLKKISAFEDTKNFNYYEITLHLNSIYRTYCLKKEELEEECYNFIKECREVINSPEKCVELAKKYVHKTAECSWVIFKNGTLVFCENGEKDVIKREAIEYLKEYGSERLIEFIRTDEEDYDSGEFVYLCCSSGEEMGTLDGIYNHFLGMDNEFLMIDFCICRERILADLEQLEISCVIVNEEIINEQQI